MVDAFNALRLREGLLFEQIRSFHGNMVISAQGYAGLGPTENAERILDACSMYILHACSDPFRVTKRAGKKFFMNVSYSEDEEGIIRKTVRPKYDWRVQETDVIQQEEGQAYWIYRGHAQHVQTALVPITTEQIHSAWKEIRSQEEFHRQLLVVAAGRKREGAIHKVRNQSQQDDAAESKPQNSSALGPQKKSRKKKTSQSKREPSQPSRISTPRRSSLPRTSRSSPGIKAGLQVYTVFNNRKR
ncbi:MAG TPA: hypothetical protein VKR06_16280 [Ktedonosporobacter sp.]|nr:hypothetical protein [Ktedonosporobacter sp.]